MKRSLRIILPLLVLVLALLLTTSLAFGASSVPVKHMATSATSKPAYSDYLYSNGTEDEYQLYAFTAPATGKLWFDATTPDDNATYTYVAFGKKVNGVFDDKLYTSLNKSEVKENVGSLDVVKGKTYYFGVKRYYNSYSDTPKTRVKVRAFVYAYSSNRLLKQSSSWLLSSGYKNSYEDPVIKYKIVPAKTGVMKVSIKEFGYDYTSAKVTLLSKTKKLRSQEIYCTSKVPAYFGVKKGVTYYLKVASAEGAGSYCYKYGIKYKITATTDRALSKKSKALKLGRKKAAKASLFVAKGAEENDWYKFYVSKTRETKIRINATQMSDGTDDKLSVTIYKGSKKATTVTVYPGNAYDITVYDVSSGKASKGTYYIKVHRNAKLSGKYTIKYLT